MHEETIGDRVYEHRKQRGWTQEELARRSGVSATTVTHVETQAFPPRERTVRLLARAFGIPADDLKYGPAVPLDLAAMFDAPSAARRRTLEAASSEEVQRYVAELVAHRLRVEDEVLEAATDAATMSGALRKAAQENYRQMVRYAFRLGELHNEAEAFSGHASVASAAG